MKFRVKSENYCNAKGKSYSRYDYTYDNEGRLIEKLYESTCNDFLHKFSRLARKTVLTDFLYAKDNKRDYDFDRYTEMNTYNDIGKISEQITINYVNKVIQRNTYFYDEKGNEVQQDNYYPLSGDTLKCMSEYDDNNNAIRKMVYGINGKLDSTVTGEYDLKGNVVEENIYDSNEKHLGRRRYLYNVNGLLDKIFYEGEKKKVEIFEFKYEYDKRGNWVKEKRLYNDKFDRVILREIKYF